MFFYPNPESRIGFKKLSEADLGQSDTSNQTHIGLYNDTLTFLADNDVVKSAMLIYEDYCDILSCYFDRIQNPDGTFRSPKIKIGNETPSVVSKIREFALTKKNESWYILWTGLESEELVFWLMSGDSSDYHNVKKAIMKDNVVCAIGSPTFEATMKCFMGKVNSVSAEIQKDMEVISQIGGQTTKNYKRKDIETAAAKFKEIGKLGEELINQYLEKEYSDGHIRNYQWVNKSLESGLPYDFIIDDNLFVDVKSTQYDFDQFVYFSNQEVDFITSLDDSKYSVFRVFDLNQIQRKLCVCNRCLNYMSVMNRTIAEFQANIEQQNAVSQSIKIGVKPIDCFGCIEPLITL